MMLHPLAKFKPYLVLKILPQRNCDSKRGSADHHTGDPMDASLREGHTKEAWLVEPIFPEMFLNTMDMCSVQMVFNLGFLPLQFE